MCLKFREIIIALRSQSPQGRAASAQTDSMNGMLETLSNEKTTEWMLVEEMRVKWIMERKSK